MKMSKFGKALGLWEFKIGEVEVALKPTMADVKKFRSILIDKNAMEDKEALFNKFSVFMVGLLKEAHPDEKEEDIQTDVEVYLSPLLEEAMIAFHWTTKEEMAKTKAASVADLKKQMSNV